ncbi:hypothetical protein [Myroides sp.]|uniref:O-antigen ligase family protein n=1 Tax=Myroides sp. TaxID=1874736 RepID=UPI0028AFF2E2|nr:hypothetical protein [Myroides sp.]
MLIYNGSKIYKKGLFFLFFFTFIGYYAVLLLFFNIGLGETSRQLTIPVRLSIVVVLLVLVMSNLRILRKAPWLGCFFIFSFCYILRIFLDYVNQEYYYVPVESILLFFVSFAFLPFVCFSILPYHISLNVSMFKGFAIGGISFSLLALIFYSKYIGVVSRLGGTATDESTLSPLSLSYSSSMIIGCFIFYLLFNKVKRINKIILLIGIIISVIPFFLGASRGSIFSIFIPFIVYIVAQNSIVSWIKYFFGLIIFSSFLIFLDLYFKSGLIERFLSIGQDIDSGSSSASRIGIWKTSFNQFLEYPIIGDKLRVNNWEGYAHNVIVESFQVVGILGTIPLLILFYKAWKATYNLVKVEKKYFWIGVIFIQAFCMNMFSGSIYTAVWLWSSMAVVLSIEQSLKQKIY